MIEGNYKMCNVSNGLPFYKHTSSELYLHEMNTVWKISSEVGGGEVQLFGVGAGVKNCPDVPSSWKIRTGSGQADYSFVTVVFTIIN